jgi:excinuclease ABC subunit B
MDETTRRRSIQEAYNREHGITPETIKKAIRRGLEDQIIARKTAQEAIHADDDTFDLSETLLQLEQQMLAAAEALDFESAARLRDRIKDLRESPTLKIHGTTKPENDSTTAQSPGKRPRREASRGPKPRGH